MLEDVREFIIDRVGAVKCTRCSNPNLVETENALICPICRTEHYANRILKRYPVSQLEGNREINWASYKDNKEKEYEFKKSDK
jgi:Zn finger protein HypA/HybF involved in hydrogenase expression